MTVSQLLFLLLALALLAYILISERRLSAKVPLIFRYVAGILAVAALLGLFFPVKYPWSRATPDRAGGLVLLTAGTPDSTLRMTASRGHVFTTDSAIARQYRFPLVRDWSDFLAQHPHSPLAIHGFGLSPRQAEALGDRRITYHRPPLPAGFTFCEWPQRVAMATPLMVYGRYHNLSDHAVTIHLLSASQAVDSAIVPARETSPFTLSAQPKQAGNSLFGLTAMVGHDTLQQEILPVSVIPAATLHVVLLAASPSFEFKFVAGWFRQMGYRTAFRSRISVDRFSTAYSGDNPVVFTPQLSASTFKEVDLLIADETELAALAASEQQAIADAVQAGMGLVLFLDDDANRSRLGKRFAVVPAADAHAETLSITSVAAQDYPGLSVAPSLRIRTLSGQQPLLYDGREVLAASQLYGEGRITAITLKSSYAWWLRDQQAAYARFWSFLIDRTLIRGGQIPPYGHSPRFPTAHGWMDMWLQSRVDTVLTINGQPYPRLQHELLSDYFRLSFWPGRTGWHVAGVPDADSAWFYVYGPTDWRAARAQELMEATEAVALTGLAGQMATKPEVPSRKEVPKWVFFLVFLLSSAVLWYSARDYNQNVI